MKKLGLIIAVLSLALIAGCMISCSNEVTVSVDEDVPQGIEWKLELDEGVRVTKGTEVFIRVWFKEGYGGSFNVSVNGKKLDADETDESKYVFTASTDCMVVIDGKTYKEVDKVELPHNVLFVEQDFDIVNPYITVHYKNGDTENIYNYTYRGYSGLETGDENISIGFTSDGRNVTTEVTVAVVDNAGYLEYVCDFLSIAAEKFDKLTASGDSAFTFFQTEGKIYYSDTNVDLWIEKGVLYMIQRAATLNGKAETYSKYDFGNMGAACVALEDYFQFMPFGASDTVAKTLRGIVVRKSNNTSVTELSMTGTNVNMTVSVGNLTYEYTIDMLDRFVTSVVVTDNTLPDSAMVLGASLYNDIEPENIVVPDIEWTVLTEWR